MDCIRAAALTIEDCEAEGRVTPKEINEAVENVLRAFMENVETRMQARKEEYLREMRMRRGETIHDEWEEEEHPRDEDGRFTFKGTGRSGGSAQAEQRGSAERENSASDPRRRYPLSTWKFEQTKLYRILPPEKRERARRGWENLHRRAIEIYGPDYVPSEGFPPLSEKLRQAGNLPETGEGGSSRFGPGREQLVAAVGSTRGILAGNAQGSAGSQGSTSGGWKKISREDRAAAAKRYHGRYKISFQMAKEAVPEVDLIWTTSFALRESTMGQRDVLSKTKGARGLMQITPETLEEIKKKKIYQYNSAVEAAIIKRGGDPAVYHAALLMRRRAEEAGVDLTNPDKRAVNRELYRAYLMGGRGARRFNELDPDHSVSRIFSEDTIRKNSFFHEGGKALTKAQVEERLNAAMDDAFDVAEEITDGG